MRGRRSQPAAVKQAKGNPGRRPIVDEHAGAQPVGDELLIGAPDWLQPEAADIWTRLAPELQRMRLLSRPDVMTFGRYCDWFAKWLKLSKDLAGADLVVTTVSEHVTMDRLDKKLQAMLLIEKRLVDLEDRFGLNPANRQRIFTMRAAGGGAKPGELPLDKPKDQPMPPAPRQPSPALGFLSRH